MQADQTTLRASLFATQARFAKQQNVFEHTVQQTTAQLQTMLERQNELRGHVENLRLAATILQELVDAVAAKNIARTEDLVNSALATIFHDQDLQFRIISEIKRNTVQYRIAIVQDGYEGTVNSYGGGPVAVIAIILKVLFNVLAKRYPFLALDESLSFLSDKYIPNASAFIKDLSNEFNMPVLLVTHQPLFTQSSDQTYIASAHGKRTVAFTRHEGPYTFTPRAIDAD